MLGRTSEAAKAVAEIRALRPDLPGNPRRYLECYVADGDLVEALIDGLALRRRA